MVGYSNAWKAVRYQFGPIGLATVVLIVLALVAS